MQTCLTDLEGRASGRTTVKPTFKVSHCPKTTVNRNAKNGNWMPS